MSVPIGRRLSGGIRNKGCTCYISCSLQILLRFKPFADFIQESASQAEIFSILQKFSKEIATPGSIIDPGPLIQKYHIDPGIQQDICEFLTNIINSMIEASGESLKSSLKSMFFSEIKSEQKSDSIVFLTIPVIEDVSTEDLVSCTLSERSDQFVSCPDLLFVQISRNIFNTNSQTLEKNSKRIVISSELDLASFNGPCYRLYAIVQHIGTAKAGHYRTYLRDSSGWILASDQNVTTSDEIGPFSHSEETPPYLLAYVRRLDTIRVIRDPLEKGGRIVMKVFDSGQMKVVRRKEASAVTADEAQEIIASYSSECEADFGPLECRFSIDHSSISKSFPSYYNSQTKKLLVILEKSQYRQMQLEAMKKASSIKATFLYNNCQFLVDFHRSQSLSKAIEVGQLIDSRAKVYLSIRSFNVLLSRKSLAKISDMMQRDNKISFLIAKERPENCIELRARLFKVDGRLEEIESLEIPFDTGLTCDDIAEMGRKKLETPSAVVYSVKDGLRMVKIPKEKRLLDVLHEGNLRIEREPPSSSADFIMVDECFNPIGTIFKFTLEIDEEIGDLERRIRNYIPGRPTIKAYLNYKGKRTRPQVPFDEVEGMRGYSFLLQMNNKREVTTVY